MIDHDRFWAQIPMQKFHAIVEKRETFTELQKKII